MRASRATIFTAPPPCSWSASSCTRQKADSSCVRPYFRSRMRAEFFGGARHLAFASHAHRGEFRESCRVRLVVEDPGLVGGAEKIQSSGTGRLSIGNGLLTVYEVAREFEFTSLLRAVWQVGGLSAQKREIRATRKRPAAPFHTRRKIG